ncbi:hypothetical protein ACC846_38405, partial [Rhizobium ruizarguesonis]
RFRCSGGCFCGSLFSSGLGFRSFCFCLLGGERLGCCNLFSFDACLFLGPIFRDSFCRSILGNRSMLFRRNVLASFAALALLP